jgi:peptidoglycan/LPS O-acetylase OafA/YrhL
MRKDYHFGGLDLVRLFAASYVMVYHLAVVSWTVPDVDISPNYGVPSAPHFPELWFFETGWVGIEIFFVLSGLVIAQSANGKSAYQFFRGRAGRLLPTIWISASATALILLTLRYGDLRSVVANYFRTLVVYRNGPWVSGVYWTLSVEIFFYASIFLLLSINAFRQIEKFAILLGGASSAYLVGVIFFGWHQQSPNHLLQHGCFFSLGILIWLCSSFGFTASRLLFSGLMIIADIMEICFVSQGQLDIFSTWTAPTVWIISVAAICVSVCSSFRGNAFTRQLGLITYPLYLIHVVLGAAILRVNPWTGRYAALALAISGAFTASWVATRLARRPMAWIVAALDRVAFALPNWLLKPFSKATSSVN